MATIDHLSESGGHSRALCAAACARHRKAVCRERTPELAIQSRSLQLDQYAHFRRAQQCQSESTDFPGRRVGCGTARLLYRIWNDRLKPTELSEADAVVAESSL